MFVDYGWRGWLAEVTSPTAAAAFSPSPSTQAAARLGVGVARVSSFGQPKSKRAAGKRTRHPGIPSQWVWTTRWAEKFRVSPRCSTSVGGAAPHAVPRPSLSTGVCTNHQGAMQQEDRAPTPNGPRRIANQSGRCENGPHPLAPHHMELALQFHAPGTQYALPSQRHLHRRAPAVATRRSHELLPHLAGRPAGRCRQDKSPILTIPSTSNIMIRS
jgi:hypothetical protein